MRPLSLTFPHGAPALGLLLIRIAIGLALLSYAMKTFVDVETVTTGVVAVVAGTLGIGTLLGLWTPVTGTLVAFFSIGLAIAWPAARWYYSTIGILGLALALLGPGIWSLDARILGWRRLDGRD